MKKISLVLIFFLVLFTLSAQDKPNALESYNAGRYADAVEICIEELETDPTNMDSYTVLGWSLVRLGRYAEALEWANKGLDIRRYDIRLIEIKGEALFYLGENLKSLQTFEEYNAITAGQKNPLRVSLVYYFMGEIYIRLQEYNHADIALTTAVYHNSNYSNWWARLGYARELAKDYSAAFDAYDQALKLNSSNDEARRGKERIEEKQNEGT